MRKTVVLPVIGVLLFAGVAAAVFFGEGTGTGPASNPTTGTAAPVTLTVTAGTTIEMSGTLAGLTPTVGTTPVATNEQIVSANVSTPGTTHVSTVVATVSTDGSGNVLNAANADAPVVGCLAAWFIVNTQTSVLPGQAPSTLTPTLFTGYGNGQTLTGAVNTAASTIWLKDLTGTTNQSACEGISPAVTIAVS
jgi:hypothetical protein